MNNERKIVKETFYCFLFPTLISTVILSVFTMTNMIIAGNTFGTVGLTAVGISIPIVFTCNLIKVMISKGGAIVFSNYLGKGDFKGCSKIFSISVYGALIIGAVIGLSGLVFLDSLIVLLGATGDVLIPAKEYAKALLIGMPFLILSPVLIIFLRNDSKQNFASFCITISCILNVLLALLFLKKFNMGMFGIGLSYVISEMISCVLAGGMILKKKRVYKLTKDVFDFKLIGKILKVGSPVAMIIILQIVLTVIINRLLSYSNATSIYTVVKYFINFMFLGMFDGVNNSIQPMLGIYYGENEKTNLKYTAYYGLKTILILSLIFFACIELFAPLLCKPFGLETSNLKQMTIQALRLIGFYSLTAGIVSFLEAFYICVEKTKHSMFIVIIDNLVMHALGFLIFLKVFDLGVMGVFYTITFSATGTIILYLLTVRPFKRVIIDGKKIWKNDFLYFMKKNDDIRSGYHKIVDVNPQNIKILTDDIIKYCNKENISEKKQYYIKLCIEELICNLISVTKKSQIKSSDYADVKILIYNNGLVHLRIRDNLTEWIPKSLEINENIFDNLDNTSDVNELGFGIILKIAKEYSFKRTIGLNNFSVVL